MSRKEHLPEELNDTERTLLSLAPRASRIDRDRLMIALGEQSAARGANPWKWATAASLLLALGLGVRPALESQDFGTQQVVEQQAGGEATRAVTATVEADEGEIAAARSTDDDFDWLRALASGRFDSSRPLTVRPEWGTGNVALRNAEVAVRDETEDKRPTEREPMLRWGDERLRRGEAEIFVPRT